MGPLYAYSLNFVPGAKVQVIGYQPRPLLKITPPSSAADRRTQTYNYIEAVQSLPVNLPDSEVSPIIRRINPKLKGQIRALFVVLSDDLYRPWPQSAPTQAHSSSSVPAPATQRVATNPGTGTGPQTDSSGNSGSEESETEEVAPVVIPSSTRKSLKRSASSHKGGPSKK